MPPVTALLAAGAAMVLATGVVGAAGPVSAAASGWHIQQTPNPPARGGVLAADSCASPTACMAVGNDRNSPLFRPLAERWNGTSWSIQRVPAPASSPAVALFGVSCPAAASCTAVGTYQASGVPLTLAEAWDGTSWSVQPTANPAGASDRELSGVSCRSAGVCTAVGLLGKQVGSGGANKLQTLAEAEP